MPGNFDKPKVCMKCGTDYVGTASSKYCLDCRADLLDNREKFYAALKNNKR